MKTIYFTNISEGQHKHILENFEKRNSSLPEKVRDEKLYQAILQISILSSDGEAFGFYETSLAEGRKLQPDDAVGSATIRVDYDPNFVIDPEEPPTKEFTPEEVFEHTVRALNGPNRFEQYPNQGVIDHIRVSVVVAPGRVHEQTYWSTQYDLIKGSPDADTLFGIGSVFVA
jgi:hypothetical protein